MLSSLLRSCSERYESQLNYSAALFYAERLVAEDRGSRSSDESVMLLARIHYRMGKTKQAYLLLQGCVIEPARYLLALCCLELGLLREAEIALLGYAGDTIDPAAAGDIPRVAGGAEGLCLMGVICRREHRREAAIRYLEQCLAVDPYEWRAITELNEMWAGTDYSAVFSEAAGLLTDRLRAEEGGEAAARSITDPLNRRRLLEDGLQISGDRSPAASIGLSTRSLRLPLPSPRTSASERQSASDVSRIYFATPGLTPIAPHDDEQRLDSTAHSQPAARTVRRVSFGPSARLSFSSAPGALDMDNNDDEEEEDDDDDDDDDERINPSKMRRTKPEEETGATAATEDYRCKLRSYVADPGLRPDAAGLKPDAAGLKPDAAGLRPDTAAAQSSIELAVLVLCLATAHGSLCRNDGPACLRHLRVISRAQFCSASVQHMIAVAYFNSSDYKASLLAHREMLRLEPGRTRGLETLSTALWHLKRARDLASLAQQAAALDRNCPEVWCVLGNCFSLQRDHAAAIKFFERAVQVDPHFAYAHTLSGHEHYSNESYDKAIASFRRALAVDEKHFNAWYGLGVVLHRQERNDLAEEHFRRARALNAGSSVLACVLGMVLQQSGDARKRSEARRILSAACLSDAMNPQLHFQLAQVLVSVDDLAAALDELSVVRELAPTEAPVYSLLGQVCLRLGKKTEAAAYLNTAVSLDPKETATMKAALEAWHEDDG